VIEAILFAAGDPVPASRIALVTGEETQTIVSAARELAAAYEENRCGMRLVQMNDLLQLCSAPEYAEYIRRALEQRKPPKLSQPALEVLAIVAYFQPVTRAYAHGRAHKIGQHRRPDHAPQPARRCCDL
ncbi:segregation and condensation protein B, partial [human gut metagenome]